MTRHPRTPSPALVDTGEARAVSEAMERARETFVTPSECRENARVVVGEHVDKCPALQLSEKVDTLDKGLQAVNLALTQITTQFNTATKLLYLGVVGAFALTLAVAGATWAISREVSASRGKAEIEQNASRLAEVRDASPPAAVASFETDAAMVEKMAAVKPIQRAATSYPAPPHIARVGIHFVEASK